MEEKIIILYAAAYNIEDEKTGRTNSGVSINYLMTDNLEPAEDGRTKGFRVMKGSLPHNAVDDISHVPGVYNATFSIKPDASGKPILRPTAVDFVAVI